MDADGVSWFRGPMLGKGSHGSVFVATLKKSKFNTTPFPLVMAVKSAPISVSASLQKEKEILDNLHGFPFVLQCFGEEVTMADNTEMVYNLLLEYASGGALTDNIGKSSGCGLPEIEVRRYTRCILEGLRHIHDCGYVHCDVKPDNILLVPVEDGKFVAKIGDLGLAKKERQSKKQRIEPSMRVTPPYLAPETVVEYLHGPPSDIWALGCVVLEMLTGKQAWGKNLNCKVEEALQMIGDGHFLPEIPNGISEEGKDFLKKCFVRKPMFRFTAEMLLDHSFVRGVDEEIFREISLPDTYIESFSSGCSSFVQEEANSIISSESEYIEEEDECDSFEESASGIKRNDARGEELEVNYGPPMPEYFECEEEDECDSFEEAASGIQQSNAAGGELNMNCSNDVVS